MMKKRIHQVPLYPRKIGVVVCDKKEDFNIDTIAEIDEHINAHAMRGRHGKASCFFVVLNPDNFGKWITIGTLAHEAYHIAMYIGYDLGIDTREEEPYAYLITWVLNTMIADLKIMVPEKVHLLGLA